MDDLELRFAIPETVEPETVLDQLAAADSDQSFNLSTSNGILTVSSQIDRAEGDIRAFVEEAVGSGVLMRV